MSARERFAEFLRKLGLSEPAVGEALAEWESDVYAGLEAAERLLVEDMEGAL